MRKIKLFCFTYAGGTKQFFDQIKNCFSYTTEVVALEYSGHGSRIKEPLLETIEETAEELFINQIKPAIENDSDSDYALFGYSMGSILAFETLKLIEKSHYRKPIQAVMAAHSPEIMVDLNGGDDLDAFIKERTIKFGGIPEKLLNNKSFWRMYLPLYKADYQMIFKYNFELNGDLLDTPLLLFYSEEDTPHDDMLKWRRFFSGIFELKEYSGKHFFIHEYYEDMAKEIEKRLVER